MEYSKCTLSPSLWPRLPLLCILNIRQLEFHRITLLTRFVFFVFFETVPFLLFVVGWSFFSLLHPSLAVFLFASVFNQDVSNWNTGAVTNMQQSKCTLSPSLWPRLPLLCILNIRQLEFHRITILTRFVIFFVCFVTVPFLLVVVGWSFFSLLHSSLAVFDNAKKFNSDVSYWNTGAVTAMNGSKCTCTLSRI